jgi:predicted amidophosphoribosyltransferase
MARRVNSVATKSEAIDSRTHMPMQLSQHLCEGIAAYIATLAELAFPQNCMSCGVENPEALCCDCFATIFVPHEAICLRCGRKRLTGVTAEDCGICHGKKHHFAEARSLYPYTGKKRALFLKTKFAKPPLLALSKAIASQGAGYWTTHSGSRDVGFTGNPHFDCVVEVPVMRPMGLRERFGGLVSWKERTESVNRRDFNFSRLFAQCVLSGLNGGYRTKKLARRLRWEYDVIVKAYDIPSQVGLSESERRRNVEGAFVVSPRHAPRLKNKTILLVDDLMTTGATVNECSRVLKRAGASRVYVLTLFSTLPTPNLAGDYDEKVDFVDDLLVLPPLLL